MVSYRQPVQKSRKKKSSAERQKKPRAQPKPKSKVWRRSKNPRKLKQLKKRTGEVEEGYFELGDLAQEDHDSDDAGLTDAQIMQKELEKIPYFRDPSFKSSFHMERSTFQVCSFLLCLSYFKKYSCIDKLLEAFSDNLLITRGSQFSA